MTCACGTDLIKPRSYKTLNFRSVASHFRYLRGVQDLIYPFWLWYPSRPEPNNCLPTVAIPILESTASRCNCSQYGMNQLSLGKDLLSTHIP